MAAGCRLPKHVHDISIYRAVVQPGVQKNQLGVSCKAKMLKPEVSKFESSVGLLGKDSQPPPSCPLPISCKAWGYTVTKLPTGVWGGIRAAERFFFFLEAPDDVN